MTKKIISIIIPVFITVFLIFFLKKYYDFKIILNFHLINWNILISCFFILILSQIIKSIRYNIFLKKFNFSYLLSISCMHNFINYIMPFWLGELVTSKFISTKKNFFLNTKTFFIIKLYDIFIYLIFSIIYLSFFNKHYFKYIDFIILFSFLSLPFFLYADYKFNKIISFKKKIVVLLLSKFFFINNFLYKAAIIISLSHIFKINDLIIYHLIPIDLIPIKGFSNLGSYEAVFMLMFSYLKYDQSLLIELAFISHLIIIFLRFIVFIVGVLMYKILKHAQVSTFNRF